MTPLERLRRGVGRLASGAVYEAKTLVARSPALAVAAARWRGHGVVLGPDAEVVIEGYPRSANSFCVAAFELAQGRPVRIAHHTHAPGHVLAAVRRGKPTLVLIREPEDAVLEFLIVRPALGVRQALRGYLHFYEPLRPHRDRFVIGAFTEVTTDLGAVIRRLNDRFGTSFTEFEHTEENVRICFEAMDAYWRGRVGDGPSLERFVGRPSEVRERWKDAMRTVYRSPGMAGPRARAEGLYRDLVAVGAR